MDKREWKKMGWKKEGIERGIMGWEDNGKG